MPPGQLLQIITALTGIKRAFRYEITTFPLHAVVTSIYEVTDYKGADLDVHSTGALQVLYISLHGSTVVVQYAPFGVLGCA